MNMATGEDGVSNEKRLNEEDDFLGDMDRWEDREKVSKLRKRLRVETREIRTETRASEKKRASSTPVKAYMRL